MTLLAHDPVFLEHDTGPHPETAERLIAVDAALRQKKLLSPCHRLPVEPIDEAAILRLHSKEQLAHVKDICSAGVGRLDSDTPVCPASYDVARHSAGACVAAADAVMRGEAKTALTLTRPPGHHATPHRAMGFCLFNNIALAADHARTAFGLDRLLIVDWDVHHGNGTQDIFYDDPTVTFLSVHRFGGGFYPGTGDADETGEGKGRGATVNVPLHFNIAAKTYKEKFREAVEATADRCKPQLILLSAGFDAHRQDPIGGLGLETEDFVEMTQLILEVADTHCDGKLVSCLEGGYNWQALADCVTAHLQALIDAEKPAADKS